jgi:hypothetical protein
LKWTMSDAGNGGKINACRVPDVNRYSVSPFGLRWMTVFDGCIGCNIRTVPPSSRNFTQIASP